MRLPFPLALAAWLLGGAADCASPPASAVPGDGPPAPPATSPATSPVQPAVRPLPASAHLLTAPSGGPDAPEVRVFRERAEWERAWAELGGGPGGGPAPAVDFAREMVVLVAMGQRSSGGHAVRVDGTSDGGGGALVLHVTATSPGPGCMTTMALTSPFDVVRVPRAAGAVRLATRAVAQPC